MAGRGDSATTVLWFFITALLSLACPGGRCHASPLASDANPTQDVGNLDNLHSKIMKTESVDLLKSKGRLKTNSSFPEETNDGDSGSTLPESYTKDPVSEVGQGRFKRKVISRGGHYMIRSSSGSSPWSSTSYDAYGTYKTSRPRGYGWNTRGRIGDSGIRITTFGEIIPDKPVRRSPRKKIARTFKGEIAQYAMIHGAKKAAMHYETRVGRRLKERIVLKFVQRYKERVEKNKKKARD